ncbi:MAG TPA: sulfatase [Actinomycetota bacterium]|nr:sulfatase [Actinomycetota bacterium]
MRTGRRRLVVLATALVAGVLVAVGTGFGQGCAGVLDRSQPRPDRAGAPTPPNIVFVLSDDQRADTLWAMPNVRRLLMAHGVTFTHFYVTTPVCCPSRSSFLTGQYPHHTGVLDNVGPNGGAQAFDDTSTLPVWLQEAGYTTGLFGKYLNGYPELDHCGVPPGWSTWAALDAEPLNQYYGFTLNRDGRLVRYATTPQNYETDVLAGLTSDFVKTAPEPFFAYVAPSNPHRPASAAPQDVGFYRNAPWHKPPSFNEERIYDKPWWRRSKPMDARMQTVAANIRERMLDSVRSLDRDVGRIVDALSQRGVLDHTIVVFASDNGFMWGEHRLTSKTWPYEESIRVPLVIRTPWAASGTVDPRLAGNIDIAPTLAQLAGTTPQLPEDGLSLVPALRGQRAPWRHDLLIEWQGRDVANRGGPTRYFALHTDRYVYVEYENDWRELYDLRRDPYELQNIVTYQKWQGLRQELATRLHELYRESCARAPCTTPAPRGAPGGVQSLPPGDE